jgi:hypothetical protein
MARVVLKFQRSRVRSRKAEANSVHILKTLALLRSDLERIDKKILAVERLAVSRVGEEAWVSQNSISRDLTSRKKRESSSRAKSKGRVVTLSPLAARLPVSEVG